MNDMNHIPASGYAAGLEGPALCGNWAHYRTADHMLIRAEARHALEQGKTDHLCSKCVAKLVRPRYRGPDFNRVWRQYLTHRRATHYDYRINFDRRVGWSDSTIFVDCRVCALLERQLARAKKS